MVRKNGGTAARAACVIGWPVEHSRSPLIHNYWLKHYGIAGAYRREAVPPPAFAAFVRSLAAHGYVGGNVTVPHKEAALALSEPDDRARAVGAANTLWLDGVLRSTNTDVEGFLDNLDACAPDWHRGLHKAVVLGAGGAARAVVYGLLERRVERIVVVNRTLDRAEALRARFGERVQPLGWDAADAALADAGLLVNSTTLGMAGQPDLAIEAARLPGDAVVADLVYVPLMTTLLRSAQARNLRTADGLGMLLHQAVGGFALWFGKKPAVTPELRALLETDLASSIGGAGGIT
ncbi:MAG TPA: shikimate dehydrogenase [Xanthobacteraceae bacterium]|nr:shikimate dehydrogenase [Xanthobacteraceae bacterium]